MAFHETVTKSVIVSVNNHKNQYLQGCGGVSHMTCPLQKMQKEGRIHENNFPLK